MDYKRIADKAQANIVHVQKKQTKGLEVKRDKRKNLPKEPMGDSAKDGGTEYQSQKELSKEKETTAEEETEKMNIVPICKNDKKDEFMEGRKMFSPRESTNNISNENNNSENSKAVETALKMTKSKLRENKYNTEGQETEGIKQLQRVADTTIEKTEQNSNNKENKKQWAFLNWSENGIPRTNEEAKKNAANYLLKIILTEDFRRKYNLSRNEAPIRQRIKEEHYNFEIATSKRKLKFEDIVKAAGLEIKRFSKWMKFIWSEDGVPRTHDKAVKNAADYLLNNIMTQKFKQKFNLKGNEAPSIPQLRIDHMDFTRAFDSYKISYYDILKQASLIPKIVLHRWDFLDWNEDGNPRTYEDVVKNAADYLKNNIITNGFLKEYNLKQDEGPKREYIKEAGRYDFIRALQERHIPYNKVLIKAGLTINRRIGVWNFLNWSEDENPRTYDEAVENAANYLLNNVISKNFKKKYNIEEGIAPPIPLLEKTYNDFISAFYYRKISYNDIKYKAGLKRSPIYPKDYYRDFPIIANLKKLKKFPKLLDHLKYVEEWGTFPDRIINNYKNCTRISDFGGKISNIEPKEAKYNFARYLVNTNKIKIIFPEDCQEYEFICKLLELSKNKYYKKEAFINPQTRAQYTHASAGHDYVLSKIMNQDENSVGVEVPIWKKHGNSYLTGHIDLIQVIDDTVFVVDYKPDETPIVSSSKMYESFINSITQVGSYGLLVKSEFKIEKLLCITYNKEGAWLYEPEIILKEVSEFLKKNKIINVGDIPWETYF